MSRKLQCSDYLNSNFYKLSHSHNYQISILQPECIYLRYDIIILPKLLKGMNFKWYKLKFWVFFHLHYLHINHLCDGRVQMIKDLYFFSFRERIFTLTSKSGDRGKKKASPSNIGFSKTEIWTDRCNNLWTSDWIKLYKVK